MILILIGMFILNIKTIVMDSYLNEDLNIE